MIRSRPLIMLLIGGSLLLLLLVFYNYGNVISMGHLDDNHFYGIMFDAGSTGTRIHAFHFARNEGNIDMVEELFKEKKPGISSHGENPEEAPEDIKELLDEAKDFIPTDHWRSTPVALKATAGLRMLPQEQADSILNYIRAELDGSLFHPVPNGVAIMDGSDEGAFSWYTVNFFLGTFNNLDDTEAVMDLGGGSTQITAVSNPQMSKDFSEYHTSLSAHGSDIDIYTRSYLGLGLMVARLDMLGGLKRKELQLQFNSACLFEDEHAQIDFGGKSYNIIGSSTASSTFDACYEAARVVVQHGEIEMPAAIHDQTTTLISYYFDTAKSLNLIDFTTNSKIAQFQSAVYNLPEFDEEEGGKISTHDITTAAKVVCGDKHRTKPLLCADAAYITTLITQGFGFDENKLFNIRKNINGQEISWALGAMVNVIEQFEIQSR